MGPPSNPRTINLIQWSMQFVALVMVVMSSYYQAASLLLSLALITWSCIPASFKSGVNTQIRKKLWKPQVKLLSEEEYNTQAHEETRKALLQLKDYCRSPDSNPWSTVTGTTILMMILVISLLMMKKQMKLLLMKTL